MDWHSGRFSLESKTCSMHCHWQYAQQPKFLGTVNPCPPDVIWSIQNVILFIYWARGKTRAPTRGGAEWHETRISLVIYHVLCHCHSTKYEYQTRHSSFWKWARMMQWKLNWEFMIQLSRYQVIKWRSFETIIISAQNLRINFNVFLHATKSKG